jgi:hypothetical protein
VSGVARERITELLGIVQEADTPEQRDEAWDEIVAAVLEAQQLQAQLAAVDKALPPWEPAPGEFAVGRVQTILNLVADRVEAQQLRETLSLIEDFCETHLPFASEKSEVVARRVLWTIRGSNDDPPHPDRAAGAASGGEPPQ